VQWAPLFLWSLSHCVMDSTWFPFDEQFCNMSYTSWKYSNKRLVFSYRKDMPIIQLSSDFKSNNQWSIVGINYSVLAL